MILAAVANAHNNKKANGETRVGLASVEEHVILKPTPQGAAQ